MYVFVCVFVFVYVFQCCVHVYMFLYVRYIRFTCMYVRVCLCVRACVCVLCKIDNALAQLLYILFSYNQHHQIKQIIHIKINKCTLFIQIIKINNKK